MIRTANLTHSVSRKAGGLHESVRRLVQSLARRGVGVRVLTTEDEFTQADLAVWAPVPVDVFLSSWPAAFGYSPRFLQVLDEYRPDLIHTHGIWLYPSIATSVYCSRRRVPYMISPHGMVDPWAVRHHRWKKVIAYAIFEGDHIRGARCIRALCESEAQSIRQMGLKNPLAVIPNGIDLPAAELLEDLLPAPWEGFVPNGEKVLLFLSRIHPKKGLENLLRAWAKVSDRSGWVLAIAGWDEVGHEAELKELCSELGLAWQDIRGSGKGRVPSRPGAVFFLGPRHGKEKAACYRACDAFILPSLSEGLPMVVLEAWAYGKPVVMTKACNLPEGFAACAAFEAEPTIDGQRGGLAKLLAATPVELGEIGKRGKELVAARFSWQEIASKVKATYEWMLSGGPFPDWFFDSDRVS